MLAGATTLHSTQNGSLTLKRKKPKTRAPCSLAYRPVWKSTCATRIARAPFETSASYTSRAKKCRSRSSRPSAGCSSTSDCPPSAVEGARSRLSTRTSTRQARARQASGPFASEALTTYGASGDFSGSRSSQIGLRTKHVCIRFPPVGVVPPAVFCPPKTHSFSKSV